MGAVSELLPHKSTTNHKTMEQSRDWINPQEEENYRPIQYTAEELEAAKGLEPTPLTPEFQLTPELPPTPEGIIGWSKRHKSSGWSHHRINVIMLRREKLQAFSHCKTITLLHKFKPKKHLC